MHLDMKEREIRFVVVWRQTGSVFMGKRQNKRNEVTRVDNMRADIEVDVLDV